MALIACNECGKQISDKAAACPNCGNPIAEAPASKGPVVIEEAPVITTQQTGKGHKTVQMIGVGIVVLGVVSCVAAETPNPVASMLISGVGAAVYLAGSISAWWSHG